MYLVTGILLIFLHSRPTEACVGTEVYAMDADQARDRALAAHKAAAERIDPDATVVWGEAPTVTALA